MHEHSEPIIPVTKKYVLLAVHFKDDIAFDLLSRILSTTVTKIYIAAHEHILTEITPFIAQRLEDRLPV